MASIGATFVNSDDIGWTPWVSQGVVGNGNGTGRRVFSVGGFSIERVEPMTEYSFKLRYKGRFLMRVVMASRDFYKIDVDGMRIEFGLYHVNVGNPVNFMCVRGLCGPRRSSICGRKALTRHCLRRSTYGQNNGLLRQEHQHRA